MKKFFTIALLTVCAAAMAQERYFYVALDVNKPVSNTSWINSTSTSGLKAGFRVFLNNNDRISLGVDVSSQTYDEYKPKRTIEKPGGAVTTDYYNYIYSYSAVASGQYYFPLGEERMVLPYAGLGVGANLNEYIKYYNIYSDIDRKWGFVARPEAGILVRFSKRKSIGAIAAVHYDYSTNKTEQFGYRNFNSIGFQVGLMFMQL
jgi:hypothetical protein